MRGFHARFSRTRLAKTSCACDCGREMKKEKNMEKWKNKNEKMHSERRHFVLLCGGAARRGGTPHSYPQSRGFRNQVLHEAIEFMNDRQGKLWGRSGTKAKADERSSGGSSGKDASGDQGLG